MRWYKKPHQIRYSYNQSLLKQQVQHKQDKGADVTRSSLNVIVRQKLIKRSAAIELTDKPGGP